jgi:hypothetical protein
VGFERGELAGRHLGVALPDRDARGLQFGAEPRRPVSGPQVVPRAKPPVTAPQRHGGKQFAVHRTDQHAEHPTGGEPQEDRDEVAERVAVLEADHDVPLDLVARRGPGFRWHGSFHHQLAAVGAWADPFLFVGCGGDGELDAAAGGRARDRDLLGRELPGIRHVGQGQLPAFRQSSVLCSHELRTLCAGEVPQHVGGLDRRVGVATSR